MSPKKHSKQVKRDTGASRPTENTALRGVTKATVSKLTTRLKYADEPREELREMVVETLEGSMYLEDLEVAAKNAGMTSDLKRLLIEEQRYTISNRDRGRR